MEVTLIDVRRDPRYHAEKDLRYRVLRAPLGMGRHEVGFAGEEDAMHVLALSEAVVIGCVLFDFASGRLRAMAVDPSWQRKGIGVRLVRFLEESVLARGVREVTLHARDTAVSFYERLGYTRQGEPFTEVGIAHRLMARTL